MLFNFRTRVISRGTSKLAWIPTLINKKTHDNNIYLFCSIFLSINKKIKVFCLCLGKT